MNHLAKNIDMTREQARYDTNVKEILSGKQVMARILKYSSQKFADMDLDSIMKNIGDPQVAKVYVDPGLSNTEKVHESKNEDTVPREGKIVYDIRFDAYCGDNSLIKILINVEAQKTSKEKKLQYSLDNRVIYYVGRMISSQKEVEFHKSQYNELKAVRSIWICMDADVDEDSINRIRFKEWVL